MRYLHRETWFAQHRAEDTVLIADVLTRQRPSVVVELGTDMGGLSALFAETVAPWGGIIHTFDNARRFDAGLLAAFPNLRFHLADVLGSGCRQIVDLVSLPGCALYTDNGHKETELALYAPHLAVGNLIGTHDYGDEVRPEFAEPLLASLGFFPHRREEFEALVDPPCYPRSLTRFWRRGCV